MKTKDLLLASVLLAAVCALSSGAAIYSNDFNTRQSDGAVGGSTTFTYSDGDLVGDGDFGEGQDTWLRRIDDLGEPTAVEVANTSGNAYAQYYGATSNYTYTGQNFGSEITTGTVTVRADIRAPSGWDGNVKGAFLTLGDDTFLTQPYADDPKFYTYTASWFGFMSSSGDAGDVDFGMHDGDGSGWTASNASITTGNWYRFVGEVDMDTKTYDVDIYDMGATQPGLNTAPPGSAYHTWSDLGFRDATLSSITTVGTAVWSAGSNDPSASGAVRMDNIEIIPEPSTLSLAIVILLAALARTRQWAE